MKHSIFSCFSKNIKFLYNSAKLEILIMVSLFFLGLFVSLLIPMEIKAALLYILDKKVKLLMSASSILLYNINPFLPITIFLNNIVVSLITYIFGFLSPLVIFLNGMIIGTVLEQSSKIYPSLFVPRVFASVLPHAWLEVPALILASAYGLKIWLKILFPKRFEPKLSRIQFIFKYTEPLFKTVVPMLLAAALIEGIVSYGLVNVIVGV